MARLLRFRSLFFSHSSKPSFSSIASPSSSLNPDADNITNRALYFLGCCKSSAQLFQIQAHLITSGLLQDSSFAGRLLKLSSDIIRDLGYTLLIFRCVGFPDSFCVNTVIKSYSYSNAYKSAVVFYVEMLRGGNFYPNGFSFPPLISACAKLSCLRLGEMCHGHAVKFGVDNVLPVQNSLIHLYACCELIDIAYKLFDDMSEKDLVSWNSIIDGYAKAGEMGVAYKVFDEMPVKNVVSWNVMITGYMNFRNPGKALKLFREMMSLGFKSNDTTMVQVIAACGRSNRLKEGRSAHGVLVKSSSSFRLIIDTTLVDMYCKCGGVDIARLIFERMPIKNSVTWNAMILGHCIHGNPVDGLNLYSEMVDEVNQLFPDELTFIGVLCGCARLGMLDMGINHFTQMTDEFHIKPNFAHYWCLANLMASVGLKEEALYILKNIPTDEDKPPEYSLWAGLFGSCRFEGDVMLGERIAKELIETDPLNFSHHNLLVNIYAAAGRWEEVARAKETTKKMGIRRVPCCNLKDLNEILSNVAEGRMCVG